MAYGVTALMSIFMYVGLKGEKNLTVFVNTQMFYPACGVILGRFIAKKEEESLPMGGYIAFLVMTALMMFISVISVFLPVSKIDLGEIQYSVWNLLSEFVIMHYLNNNLIAVFAGEDVSVLQNQTIQWKDIPIAIVQSLIFAVFILAPVFGKKEQRSETDVN